MAKRQRTLQKEYFRSSFQEGEVAEGSGSSSDGKRGSKGSSILADPVEVANKAWKDSYYTDFDWIEFNSNSGRVFCKVCRDKGGRGVFAKAGSVNVKISAFQDHARSEEHKRLSWAFHNGCKKMAEVIKKATVTCDEALLALFRAAHYMGTSFIPFARYPDLCRLLVSVKACITETMYHDEKSCSDFVFCISFVIQKKKLHRIRDAKYFGLMIDESTDISVTGHLVVFATFVEDGDIVCVFLGLLHILDGRKDAALIFDTLLTSLKEWGLDTDKCVAFGSDGAATMLGRKTGVATRLKEKVNPFLTSVHCVAHRTNLAALDAAKKPQCRDMSKKIDAVVNGVAKFFKTSSKRKTALQNLQRELNDSEKSMKRYQKVRWLSRWQAITTLCDSLESVLVCFRTLNEDGCTDEVALSLYTKLRNFKFIYCLYFLADILHSLSMLSRVFQYKFVDVSAVGSIIATEIAQLRMLFVTETADLNASTFNEETGYHILPDFGPDGGYMKRLSAEIRGARFHSVEMIRDRTGADLEEALSFQKFFAEAVIDALETRFGDNGVIGCFKILSPSNMPVKQVGLRSWGVTELETILSHFGVDRAIGSKVFPAMIDASAVKREFLAFKLQATTEWQDKTFRDLWTMVSWNPTLQLKYSNLLAIADIARIQCVSTAQCERAFSVQNCIKTKFRNRLQTRSLESIMRIALEGPADDVDVFLVEAIALWKNSRKFRYLFSNPARYLANNAIEDDEGVDQLSD